MRDAISELKAIDLLTHIGGKAERAGRATRVNPCPICGHNECFTVYDSNTYHCFSCLKSGTIIDYEIDCGRAGDVSQAILQLCDQYKIKQEAPKHKNIKTAKQEEIEKVFNLAADWYHAQLLASKPGLAYMTEIRKRSVETLKSEKVGYAATGKGLTAHLSEKKIPLDTQIASGLVAQGEGGVYDHFRNGMIIYPGMIRSQVCDFTGKPIDKAKGNPYRLTIDKRLRNCLFYGQDVMYGKRWIVVEGQEDRNALLDAGYRDAIAILGGLSDEQIQMMQDRAEDKSIYLCMDSDDQGQKYVEKLIAALAGIGTVFVMDTGDSKDIDELLKNTADPGAEVRRLMAEAQDPVSWHIKRIPDTEMNPYQSKIALKPIIEIISREKDEFLRSAYITHIEKELKTKPRISAAITKAVRELIRKDCAPVLDEGSEQERSVIRKGTQYLKITKDSLKVISDFVMTIHRYIEDDGVRYYEVSLHTFAGSSRPIVLSNEQRINMKMFDAAVAGMGPYYFYGTLNDLKEVWQLEEERADIKSYTCRFNRYGWIPEHKIWLFSNAAYKNGKLYLPDKDENVIVIDGIGYQSQRVRVYGGDLPQIEVTGNPSLEYVHEIIENVWKMWDADAHGSKRTFKGFMAMGLLASCVYLPEIVARENKYPYLLAFGPPGTGKSEAMQFIMNMWGFRNGGENWGEATPAGISMAMEQLSCIPYWIEEFSNTMGASNNQQRKVELLKNVYNRVSSGKGGLSGRTVYEVNAALFLTGQDRPENQALLSRCVVLRKESPTETGSAGYYRLKSEGRKLTLVLRWLLENKNEDSIKLYWQRFDQLMSELKTRVKAKVGDYNERTAVNYAIIATGFSLFGFEPEHDTEFLKWIVDECVVDMTRKQAEDIVYRFFSDIEVLFMGDMSSVVTCINNNELYLHYPVIYNEWVKNLKSTGMQEYIGREGLLDYMRKDVNNYWIAPNEVKGMHRRYFGYGNNSVQHRCIGVQIDRLPDNIKQIVESWNLPSVVS